MPYSSASVATGKAESIGPAYLCRTHDGDHITPSTIPSTVYNCLLRFHCGDVASAREALNGIVGRVITIQDQHALPISSTTHKKVANLAKKEQTPMEQFLECAGL